jgi:ATP-binding protein involved in chromosome partitioning
MTKEEVIETISGVKHPVINFSLLDLGIVKNIRVEDDKVKITFAFPFPHIPIKDILVNLVDQAMQSIGVDVEYDFTVMNEEERARFIRMEMEGWKGG